MTRVSQFWIDFERAWNSHDATAIAAHFEEDCCLTFFDGREFNGKKAITEFYSNAFSIMPSRWIHRTSIEEEVGLSALGVFRIEHAIAATEVLSGGYSLELSTGGSIMRLVLRKKEPIITTNAGKPAWLS